MIGMCHKCGFLGDSPPKDQGPTEEEWAEMQVLYRKIDQDLATSELARHDLEKRLFARDQAFYEMEAKLDTMLQILMAQTDAKRLNIISKIHKRNNPSKLLLSIRKANQNEL
jgi:hypothetical protein